MMTLHEVAAELQISHQAVWEIEKRAIKKVQKRLKELGMDIDDLRACLGINWETL